MPGKRIAQAATAQAYNIVSPPQIVPHALMESIPCVILTQPQLPTFEVEVGVLLLAHLLHLHTTAPCGPLNGGSKYRGEEMTGRRWGLSQLSQDTS